jgi:hypothetical protein
MPLPKETNPKLVFERLFGGGGTADRARRDARRKSVLDFVRQDTRDVAHQVSSNDRRKLDEYFTAIRDIELRIERAAQLPDPTVPDGVVAPEGAPKDLTAHIRLMADLMVLAFQTDTTRVATMACGSDSAWFPGVVTVGSERYCHTLEHQGNAGRPEDADPIAREACRQIHAWYTSLFAEMVRKMKAIDEGGSSLLDNTMLLYTSYMANGNHERDAYPALLVGNAQGTLKTGRQVDFEPDTPMSNLYVEMLDRMGAKPDSFGESHTSPKARYGGRLPGLV